MASEVFLDDREPRVSLSSAEELKLLVIADIISKRGQEAKSMTLGELADILRERRST
uniref:Uncharacterized protein n=1 Tax=Fagus sylvatica TaxID=28930 RepID=A0A2N9FR90_FAGSY